MPTPHIIFRKNSIDRGEILLYDTVGRSPWSDNGMSDKDFLEQLDALGPVKSIDLRINSEGGLIQDGLAIYNALVRHGAEITAHVDGLAASIATVIMMAGDEIKCAANASIMIHDPQGGMWGSSEDLRREADVLDKLRDTIAGVYASRSGKPAADWIASMGAETWYTADEAQAAGLVTEVVPNKTQGEEPENCVSMARINLSRFRSPPKALVEKIASDRRRRTNDNARRRLDLLEKAGAV